MANVHAPGDEGGGSTGDDVNMSKQAASHSKREGRHSSAIPLVLKTVGIVIILGTIACSYNLLGARMGESKQGTKSEKQVQHRSETHASSPRRLQGRAAGGQGLGQQPWLQAQGNKSDQLLLVQPHSEGDEGLRHQSQQEDWAVYGTEAVWSKLLTAGSPAQRNRCSNPPCVEGNHIHTTWSDFGEEMGRVQGSVVVRRPDLTVSNKLAPATSLDFATTLQSYFTIFKSSLWPSLWMTSKMEEEGHTKAWPFFSAVRDGDTTAGKYLSSYYNCETEMPKLASDGYEVVPTVVSMADVFISNVGVFWNSKDRVVPNTCRSEKSNPSASIKVPPSAESYEKVLVLTSMWGAGYYHFVVESLPRIMTMMDVLLEHPDIKVAVSSPGEGDYAQGRKEYIHAFLEILGVDKERIIFVGQPIFAKLAFVPESVTCSQANAAFSNMLRAALLQGMYPTTRGVPPPLPRPAIVLIVRHSRRGLKNNIEVREALEQNFPSFDVVEFIGNGTTLSQLQTFATASVIVAPHGAGLSNSIVLPLHTPVLEIAPYKCPNCYLNLAVKLHSIYARHPGAGDFDEDCNRSWEPEPAAVVGLVSDLLEAKRQADAADPPKG